MTLGGFFSTRARNNRVTHVHRKYEEQDSLLSDDPRDSRVHLSGSAFTVKGP